MLLVEGTKIPQMLLGQGQEKYCQWLNFFQRKNCHPAWTYLASIYLIHFRIFLFCYCSNTVSRGGEKQTHRASLFGVNVTATILNLRWKEESNLIHMG